MRRPRANDDLLKGPYPCYFNCGSILNNKHNIREFNGWHWFTGYGANTVHFCPKCFASRRHKVETIRVNLNVKPEGYPKIRRTPDGNSAPSEG